MSLSAPTYPRAATALSGLGLTAQIALAATDGVPVVKQVIGVVARIVTLAAEMEARHDALHTLVHNAREIGQRVEAVASDRPVERLSEELSSAVQAFLVVTTLDTNVRVTDSSRCIGELRRLHDFEVDKLVLVTEDTDLGAPYTVKYYSARIGSESATDYNNMQQRIIDHDRMLGMVSTVQKTHPNIARFYGRSSGDTITRFTVMKSGVCPVDTLAHKMGFGQVLSIALEVADAARYLEEIGVTWNPGSKQHIFLDDVGRPTIGLKHDLCAFSPDKTRPYHHQLAELYGLLYRTFLSDETQRSAQLFPGMFPELPLEDVFGLCDLIWTSHQVIPRTLMVPASSSVIRGTAVYLNAITDRLAAHSTHRMPLDAIAVFFCPSLSSAAIGKFCYAQYEAWSSHEDLITMVEIDETDKERRYTRQDARIPPSRAMEKLPPPLAQAQIALHRAEPEHNPAVRAAGEDAPRRGGELGEAAQEKRAWPHKTKKTTQQVIHIAEDHKHNSNTRQFNRVYVRFNRDGKWLV
ncbi:hypothetical protein AURDEDRAFT_164191 [Auricularia subglabra TFB-10046 SS5]|nr:hypothetical protein AURDEDRAFT_164191 [Auricularia subglabra TFB-10046 SS5]